MLPLSETDGSLGNSPYSSPSAFAGNPLYISMDELAARGLLQEEELRELPRLPEDRVDYEAVRGLKAALLRKAFRRFSPSPRYEDFVFSNEYWLHDYTLFTAIKTAMGGASWNTWPAPLRFRERSALRQAAEELRETMDFVRFQQYLFFSQMIRLREESARLDVEIAGDLPIYVNYDSADVWANPELFRLDGGLRPEVVAGVPPDYFSRTGQLWGNPLYRWDVHARDGFSWWMARLRHALGMFHVLRIDHFRGLLSYWAVPFGETTAEKGTWRPAPSREFFSTMRKTFTSPVFLAENLGVITPDVTEAMENLGLPGMAVLQFAFSGDMKSNPHIPHNFGKNLAAYSGTHDNNTILGWYREDASEGEKTLLSAYAGRSLDEEDIPGEVIRLVMSSVADRAVIPMQDYLEIGSEGRMNIPSTPKGNWEWRAERDAFRDDLSSRLARLAGLYGRL